MVTMYLNGITITVHAADVNFYKQAGYSVVDPPKVVKLAAPVENNEETGDAEPAKKPAKKK